MLKTYTLCHPSLSLEPGLRLVHILPQGVCGVLLGGPLSYLRTLVPVNGHGVRDESPKQVTVSRVGKHKHYYLLHTNHDTHLESKGYLLFVSLPHLQKSGGLFRVLAGRNPRVIARHQGTMVDGQAGVEALIVLRKGHVLQFRDVIVSVTAEGITSIARDQGPH